MGEINLRISQAQLDLAEWSEQDLRVELATYLYKMRAISFGKAREIAGLDIPSFWQELGRRGIDVDYTIEDYEQDREILSELLKQHA